MAAFYGVFWTISGGTVKSAAELSADLLQNPHVAQVRIELPDAEERLRFLQCGWAEKMAGGRDHGGWAEDPEGVGTGDWGLGDCGTTDRLATSASRLVTVVVP